MKHAWRRSHCGDDGIVGPKTALLTHFCRNPTVANGSKERLASSFLLRPAMAMRGRRDPERF
jgi:hypothetical protein